ncbi:amidohydrolase family protein [Mycobacteroides salmoniphilum]|uniref:amidohydrolase family protein n=1 Tax=Mycobacteroides salmoniphilum TaxID=404941 RepID=UPI001066E73D|nr:amidohydrolase family protein [Mycobacteroides salmoniphilum]TDZ89544.1 Amidohydrolase [Mycobacteroides salmoniphilum]
MIGLVDVHAHFLTEEYVSAAQAAGHIKPDGMPKWPDWNLEEQLGSMDRRDIRRAILSISSPGMNLGDITTARAVAEQVNDAAAKIVRDHPGRFGFFASLPLPDIDASVGEVRRAIDTLEASGVIIESNIEGRYLGDPLFEPLWAELNTRRTVLFVHPTSPAGSELTALGRPLPMLEFMFDSTRAITDLIFAGVTQRYPDIRIVVPHSGAALAALSDRIAMFHSILAHKDGGPGWREMMRALWFDTAGTPFPRQLPLLADVAGIGHIVYGSDSCWTPVAGVDAQLASIDQAPPPHGAGSWRELTSRNAERLLT